LSFPPYPFLSSAVHSASPEMSHPTNLEALETQMRVAAANEDYDTALSLQRTIKELKSSQAAVDKQQASTLDDLDDEALLSIDVDAIAANNGAANAQDASPSTLPFHKMKSRTEISPSSEELHQALFHLFGHERFFEGQEDVITNALHGNDCAVFWATGRGKSICYQLPALVSGKTVVVVSPLISLMVDQVNKLNAVVGRGEKQVSAFLGSAQTDSSIEARALAGEFVLVYVSPEKLLFAGGCMLARLESLHAQGKLLLVAIDEAHCVSEWGHDFRPEFRQLGQVRKQLRDVPIMALTATAVPRVREDIVSTLQLRAPFIATSTSYRKNLSIGCQRKEGLHKDLQPLVKSLNQLEACGRACPPSTIIYAPTRNDVEQLHQYLLNSGVSCDYYHGSLSPQAREKAHLDFLSGTTAVIVATVAFGMGIDKPDVRKVVHYGAPKTVEEYYQHIGRAGRDGGPAECTMYFSEADFSRYASDFYLGGLTPSARKNVEASTANLRTYATECNKCRWGQLLRLLGEMPTFLQCGSCDSCTTASLYAGDLERDFSSEVCALLSAVQSAQFRAWTHVEKALDLKALRPRRSAQTMKEFVPILEQRGVITRRSVKNPAGYGAYDVYSLSTPQGFDLLRGLQRKPPIPYLLPVPKGIRAEQAAQEEAARKKREEVAAARRELLLRSGVSLAAVPEQEFEPGAECTAVSTALLHWARTLAKFRERGQEGRATAYEQLYDMLLAWRSKQASSLKMAPASVIADHLLLRIAYVQPCSLEALLAVGARLTAAGGSEILQLIVEWKEAHSIGSCSQGGSQPASQSVGSQGAGDSPQCMVLPNGPYQPTAWKLAVPPKKASPAWEVSWTRFSRGEHLEVIAMDQPSGKPIQADSVLKHVLTALEQGKPVDLNQLARSKPPPNSVQWDQLEKAEAALGKSVVDDEKLNATMLLAVFLDGAAKPFQDRSDADKAQIAPWFILTAWFIALRRTGFVPSFGDESPSKRRRVM